MSGASRLSPLRLPLFAALLAPLTAPLVACTDSGVDGPPIVDTGSYTAFIQHGWQFPDSYAAWLARGFDFDHDGQSDNQAGVLIGALGGLGLPIGDANAEQVRTGEMIVAHVIRADQLEQDDAVAWQLWTSSGAPPRYDGTDQVTAANVDGALAGPIVDGTLRATWGDATLRVPLFPGQPPVSVPTRDAQVELHLRGTCYGKVGGLLDAAALTAVLDQVAVETLAHMAAHPEHAFTQTARDVFDRNRDGVVAAAEIVAVGRTLLTADVDTDDDGDYDAVTVAFGFDCAPAQLATPPTF